MIGVAAFSLSMIGYFSFFSTALKRNAEDCLFYTISLIVFFLYIFGIVGYLSFGSYALCATGIIFLVYTAINKSIKITLAGVSWVALFSTPFAVFIFAISKNYVFTGWDEFSFWGSSIKLIYEEQGIYSENTPLNAFKNYPPAQQLWQFYVLQLFGWSEKVVLAAHSIFVLTCIQFAITKLSFKNKIASYFIFISATASIYYFNYDFGHVYVDQLLAAYFACALLLSITAKDKTDYVLLGLTLANLVIIKQIGLVFSLFVVCSVFSCRIINGGMKKKVFKAALLISSIFLALIITTYKSWSHYVQSINFPSNIKSPSLESFFYSPLNDKLFGTLKEFSKRFYSDIFLNSNDWFIRFSMAEVIIGMLIFTLTLTMLCKGDLRKKLALINSGMFVFGVAYIGFLIFCYIAFFSTYESLKLASFERYSSSFYLAWVLLSLSMLLLAMDSLEKKYGIILSLIVTATLIFSAPKQYLNDVKSINPNPRYIDQVEDVSQAVSFIKKHISKSERAYIIDQDTNGYSAAAFNYLMLPNKPFSWCWSLGDKYRESDVWTCKKTLADVLRGVSYLYLKHTDNQFWKENKVFFTGVHDNNGIGVYKISWSGDGKLTLSPL